MGDFTPPPGFFKKISITHIKKLKVDKYFKSLRIQKGVAMSCLLFSGETVLLLMEEVRLTG